MYIYKYNIGGFSFNFFFFGGGEGERRIDGSGAQLFDYNTSWHQSQWHIKTLLLWSPYFAINALCIYIIGINLVISIPGRKFWYCFTVCSVEGVETKTARSSIWPLSNFLQISIPSSSWQIKFFMLIKMCIVLLHFASDIIPSAVVTVLSVSLAVLEELKHKNKSNSSVIN